MDYFSMFLALIYRVGKSRLIVVSVRNTVYSCGFIYYSIIFHVNKGRPTSATPCIFHMRVSCSSQGHCKGRGSPHFAGQDTEARRGEAGSVKVIELAGGRSCFKVQFSWYQKAAWGGKGWVGLSSSSYRDFTLCPQGRKESETSAFDL